MAITCNICGTELDALAGGRCRKCRQLVCSDCIISGSATSPEGLICRSCPPSVSTADAEPAAGEQEADSTIAAGVLEKSGLPLWCWVAFGLLLLGLFFAIAGYPDLKARLLAKQVASGDPLAAREAARKLVRMGGAHALRELISLAESGPEEARTYAIEALGRYPHPHAVMTLKRIARERNAPESVRLTVQKALLDQKRISGRQP